MSAGEAGAPRTVSPRQARELLDLAQTQLQSGVSTAIDVTRARTQKVAADGAALVAQNAFEQAQIELARSLGESPSTRYELTDSLSAESLVGAIPLNADSLISLAMTHRPELKVAAAAGDVARAMKRSIQAERLPRVGLFADYGASGLHPGDAIATRQLGVQVSIPLLDGFRREARRHPACRADLGRILDAHPDLASGAHFHRVMVTRVPCPGVLEMSNSLTSRREPPSPSPMPMPVVKPSFNACCTSGMPGPSSSNVIRTPLRAPSSSDSSVAVPPRP